MKIDLLELAWAAGFFDGEGCTAKRFKRRTGTAQPYLTIGQSNREVLDRFRRAVGGFGSILGPYPTRGQPVYFYRTSRFEYTQAVIAMLWRFLGSVKRQQAISAFQHVRSQVLKSPGPKPGYQQSPQHTAKRVEARRGYHHSLETRVKISLARRADTA